MTATTEVTVPMHYSLTIEDLVLDPSSYRSPLKLNLTQLVTYTPEEIERVLTMTVMLFHRLEGKATLGECLDTAMVWERG